MKGRHTFILWELKGFTLQGINISHLGKRKLIFKSEFWWDMLVPKRVSCFFKLKCTSSTSDARKGTQFVDQFSIQRSLTVSGKNSSQRGCSRELNLQFSKKKVGVSDISDTSRVAQNTSKSHTSLKPLMMYSQIFAHKTPPQLCENTPCCKVALWVLKGFTNSCQPRVAFFQSTHTSKHHTSGT